MKDSDIKLDQLFKGALADVSMGEGGSDFLPQVKQFVEKVLAVSTETEDSYLKVLNEMGLSHEMELTALRKEQVSYEDQLAKLQGQLSGVTLELERRDQSLSEEVRAKRQLEEQVESLKRAVVDLGLERDQYVNELSQSRVDCKALENDLKAADESLVFESEEVERLSQKLALAIASGEEQICALKAQIEESDKFTTERICNLERQRSNSLKESREIIDGLNQKLHEAQESHIQEVTSLKAELSVRDGQIFVLTNDLSAKNQLLAERIVEFELNRTIIEKEFSSEVSRLNEKIVANEQIIAKQFAVLSNLEMEKSRQQHEIQYSRFVGALAHHSIDELSKECSVYISNGNALSGEKESLSRQLAETYQNHEKELASIQDKLDKAIHQVETSRSAVLSREEQISALKTQIEESDKFTTEQICNLERQRSNSLKESREIIDGLNQKLHEAQASHIQEVISLKAEIQAALLDLSHRNSQIESLNSELVELGATLSVRDGQIFVLTNDLSAKNQLLAERMAEFELNRTIIEKEFSSEVNRLNEKIVANEQIIAKQFTVLSNLEMEKSRQQHELQYSRFVGALAHHSIDELSKECSLYISNGKVLSGEKESLSRQLAETYQNHEQELASIQDKLDKAILQVETSRSAILSREEQISALKTQIEESDKFTAEQICNLERQRSTSLKESREIIDGLNQKVHEAQESHIQEVISLKAEIQAALLDLSHRNNQIESLNGELNGLKQANELQSIRAAEESAALKNQFESALNELRDTVDGLKSEISNKDSRIAVLISDLGSKNQSLIEQVEQFDQTRSEIQKEFNSVISQLHKQIQDAHSSHFREIAEQQKQVQVARLAVVDRESKIDKHKIEIENLKKEMLRRTEKSEQTLSESKRDMSACIDGLQLQINDQKETFDRDAAELRAEMQLMRYQLDTSQQLISERDNRIEKIKLDAESNCSELLRKLNESEQRHVEISKEYAERMVRMNELLNVSQSRQVQEVLSLGNQVNALKLNGQGPEIGAEIQKVDQSLFLQISRADQDRADAQKELILNLATMGERLQEVQKKHAHELTILTREIEELRPKAEVSQEAIDQLRRERDCALEQLRVEVKKSGEAVQLKDTHLGLERLAQQLEQREKQLRQYAINLNDEKAEVLKRAKYLADEIRVATSLNPLKDFLAMTEFELNKIEVQLRKTPMISLDRSRIEANYSLVVEQRDFLKAAITNSKIQLEHQAAELIKIARPEKLAPIPPLPPRS